MKRLSTAVAALSVGVSLVIAMTAGAAAPRAGLGNFICRHALDPASRTVSIDAVMRPLPGTRELQLRFDLLVRRGGSPARLSVIRAGDLGVWITPGNPTLGQLPGDVWNFAKPVVELGAPASYRFRVGFRWVGARRRVIGSTVLYSQSCRERELRPDLLVPSITVSPLPGLPGKDLYTAVIRNAGATAAGPFDVLFAPGDNSPPKTHTVALLGPYSSRIERYLGPLCTPASAPTVTVDSAAQVDDLNRSNNSLTAACPVASGS